MNYKELVSLREMQQDNLSQDAVNYLQSKGLKLGKDFSMGDAKKKADMVAFENEVDKNMEIVKKGKWIKFDPYNDCDDDCRGWDGDSLECDCKKNRVYWETGYYHSFKKPDVYACAERD